jgi:hypothetical protein
MLSFLREQDPEDSLGPKTPDTADKGAAESTPQAQEQEYLTVAAKAKQVRKTTILLVVLFGIGLLSLWLMMKKSAPEKAAASVSKEEEQIEKALPWIIGAKSEMFNRTDEIVTKFDEFSDVQQVQADELAKNPFEPEMFVDNVPETSDTTEGLRPRPPSQLLSIMQSDRGYCCMIEDKILYEGDSIRGYKVCQISDNFVKLELEDERIVLTLSQ